MKTFEDLNLSKQLQYAIDDLGFVQPTPIQSEAFSVVRSGKDVVGIAQTGTGKTAGFTLPLLERLAQTQPKMQKKQIRALVLTPTRELAAQVAQSISDYGKYTPYRSTVIFGGVGIKHKYFFCFMCTHFHSP